MPDDTGELRCGVCSEPYLPGQSIRIIATKSGMVLIHKECEATLTPLRTAEAVVDERSDIEAGKERKEQKVGGTG